mmetsp:Transcript_31344/g.91426  ORF Transcript_31344/g.91426 Transcript_31344/m.91426 type:complete len:331 (+) Transcript_31344:1146-2138(+)
MSKARTNSDTTSRSSSSSSPGKSCESWRPFGDSFGKYVCKKRVSKPSDVGSGKLSQPPSSSLKRFGSSCSICPVSRRQTGHCEMRYSPGWCAMGPRTKHFQQKRWLHESSTMSEMASRQMGHCCDSWSAAAEEALFGPKWERTRAWPSDSTAAWSSAKSEPLKNVCRDSQPARSAATSSRPKLLCFLRFFKILTTATAFQTAYFLSWSTSFKISTSVLSDAGRCLEPPWPGSKPSSRSAGGHAEPDDDEADAPMRLEEVGTSLLKQLWNSSARMAVRCRRSCCLLVKQAFTWEISRTSSASKSVLADSAAANSRPCWNDTMSLIRLLSNL